MRKEFSWGYTIKKKNNPNCTVWKFLDLGLLEFKIKYFF